MTKIALQLLLIFGLATYSYSQKSTMVDAFKNKQYRKALHIGKELIVSQPQDFDILIGIGKAHNALNEFDKAIPFLEKANIYAKKDWQYSWSSIALMESNFAVGNIKKSLSFYKKSQEYRGTKSSNKELKSLALLFGFDHSYKDWKTMETENITFHFQRGTAISDRITYIKDRQNAFSKINSFFNSNLPKKIDFFVWKSNAEALKILNKSLGFSTPKYTICHNN